MAASIADQTADVIEGFLCPICMRDLGTVSRLQDHFDQEHNTEEDKDVLQSLKDLIGKAKKKILSPDIGFFDGSLDDQKLSVNKQIYLYEWDSQELGETRSHTQEFLKTRSNRMDCYAAETNKLIIRLDKILGDISIDPDKRRQHEQNIVPWINDEDVKLCPQCAKSFNLIRRRHHCRLCGSVQCQQCSDFILHSFARKLISPGYEGEPSKNMSTGLASRMETFNIRALRRTGSASSLGSLTSLVDSTTGEGHIRVCIYCKQLLGRRALQMENHTQKLDFVELYDQLQTHQKKALELLPMYLKMSDSLHQGESNYNLKDAQECRLKLLKLTEYIDAYSKKIQSFGVGGDQAAVGGIQLSLQQKIRLGAVNFLKDNLMGLPRLPNDDELEILRDRRRKSIEKKIALEKQSMMGSSRLSEERKIKQSQRPIDAISVDHGWGPQSNLVKGIKEEEDPMLQQIHIIRNYIQQARRDNKYDEVAMLEANLQELQEEYNRSKNSI